MTHEAIVGGMPVDAPNSPVLFLAGPEGTCTATLLAPRLVATARHCVASTTTGPFSCTAAGDLIPAASGAGQIGKDDSPGSLSFYSAPRVSAGVSGAGAPDAVGIQIWSTQTPSACKDDVAFVVLDRAIPGLVPAPIRIDGTTQAGELVSVSGFGLTDQAQPAALRSRTGVPIIAVGPDKPPMTTQPAPVRAVRLGPVTCQGDSGGPIASEATGAVIALVSLGSQAGSSGPYCASGTSTDTVGPRLAAYRDLALMAFQAAGASPVPEFPSGDAAPDSIATPDALSALDAASAAESPSADSTAAPDAALEPESVPTGGQPGPASFRAIGSSCAMAPTARAAPRPLGEMTIALGLGIAAARRRRR